MSEILKHKVLVIGGSSGIGLATSRLLAAHGARVKIASRSAGKLKDASVSLDGVVSTQVLDILDETAVETFFAQNEPWDHIVISAAETATGPVRRLAMDDAKRSMESKFWGAYRVARHAKLTERGSLTFISGYLSERPSSASVLQGAINASLEALSRGLALELSPVRVNTVSPGLIDTPLWSRLEESTREAIFNGAAANLPAKRLGKPEDVANAILFLITTPFATGSNVRVDGGGVIA